MSVKDLEAFTTWGQLAEFLHVNKKTAMKWNAKYGLPVKRVGNRILATKRSVLDWIDTIIREEAQKKVPKVYKRHTKSILNDH